MQEMGTEFLGCGPEWNETEKCQVSTRKGSPLYPRESETGKWMN